MNERSRYYWFITLMNLLGANIGPYCFRLRGWVRFVVGRRVVMAPQQRSEKRDRQVSILMTCHFVSLRY